MVIEDQKEIKEFPADEVPAEAREGIKPAEKVRTHRNVVINGRYFIYKPQIIELQNCENIEDDIDKFINIIRQIEDEQKIAPRKLKEYGITEDDFEIAERKVNPNFRRVFIKDKYFITKTQLMELTDYFDLDEPDNILHILKEVETNQRITKLRLIEKE